MTGDLRADDKIARTLSLVSLTSVRCIFGLGHGSQPSSSYEPKGRKGPSCMFDGSMVLKQSFVEVVMTELD